MNVVGEQCFVGIRLEMGLAEAFGSESLGACQALDAVMCLNCPPLVEVSWKVLCCLFGKKDC